MAEYIEREKALEIIDQIFFSTDPTGDEQIGILKCRTAIREIIPAADVAECLEELKLLKELRKPKKPMEFKRTAHDFETGICPYSHYKCEYIKPYNHEYEYTDYKCPTCNKKLSDGTLDYCCHCGQALDWSD